jgi:hypothetical protein
MNELYNISEKEENYNKIFEFILNLDKIKTSYVYNSETRMYTGTIARVKNIKMILEMPEHRSNYNIRLEEDGYTFWESERRRKSDKKPFIIESTSNNESLLKTFFNLFIMMNELTK